MNAKMERRMMGDEWDSDEWTFEDNAGECYCSYDEEGDTEEWCDVCVFGSCRAAYYEMREYTAQKHAEQQEAVKNTLITNELAYRIRCIEEADDIEERLENIQSLLRYLWDKQVYLSNHEGFLNTVIQKCDDWMNDSDADSIQGTILMTLEILSHI
jgi:hypothetical protein